LAGFVGRFWPGVVGRIQAFDFAGGFFEFFVDILCGFLERFFDFPHLVFPTGLEILGSTLEFSQTFTKRFSKLRKLAGSEDEKRNKKNNEQFLKP